MEVTFIRILINGNSFPMTRPWLKPGIKLKNEKIKRVVVNFGEYGHATK